MTNFGPAARGENTVYGNSRPGYNQESNIQETAIADWIADMQRQGIQRVCCLLDDEQLGYYETDLLAAYRQAFGADNVCHAPIPDYHLADPETLTEVILPFLRESEQKGQKVVVHCSGGMGRTGHVLAAWLVHRHGLDVEEAVAAVRSAPEASRNPREAVGWNATEEEFQELFQGLGEA
jgi:protein-tyrosine phosphatase